MSKSEEIGCKIIDGEPVCNSDCHHYSGSGLCMADGNRYAFVTPGYTSQACVPGLRRQRDESGDKCAGREIAFFAAEWQEKTRRQEKIEIGRGVFRGFGVCYEEFENGPGNYSTAIIELSDGSLINHSVEYVQFVKD